MLSIFQAALIAAAAMQSKNIHNLAAKSRKFKLKRKLDILKI
jgi:hypothetical protein